MYTILVIIFLAVMFLSAAIKILNEYERGVIFRLGWAGTRHRHHGSGVCGGSGISFISDQKAQEAWQRNDSS